MKKTGLYLLLACAALVVSCSDKKKNKDLPEEQEKSNHIYYLAIGNRYYNNANAADGSSPFIDVKGANASADDVSELLSHYGKGIKLKSAQNNYLTKEIMNTYIDSVINLGIKDSLSTIVVYYCGHGFSDNSGNIFMVPGNHSFKNGDAASLKSLVSVNEIQEKFQKALLNNYKDTIVSEKEKQDLVAMVGSFKPKTVEDLKGGKAHFEKVSATLRELGNTKTRRPRFVILADCCTDNFNVKNNYYAYDFTEMNQNKAANYKKMKDPMGKAIVKAMDNAYGKKIQDYMAELNSSVRVATLKVTCGSAATGRFIPER